MHVSVRCGRRARSTWARSRNGSHPQSSARRTTSASTARGNTTSTAAAPRRFMRAIAATKSSESVPPSGATRTTTSIGSFHLGFDGVPASDVPQASRSPVGSSRPGGEGHGRFVGSDPSVSSHRTVIVSPTCVAAIVSSRSEIALIVRPLTDVIWSPATIPASAAAEFACTPTTVAPVAVPTRRRAVDLDTEQSVLTDVHGRARVAGFDRAARSTARSRSGSRTRSWSTVVAHRLQPGARGGRRHADHLSVGVHGRATRVARLRRGGDLDQSAQRLLRGTGLVGGGDRLVDRGHDTLRRGGSPALAVRVAERDDRVGRRDVRRRSRS